MKKVLDLLRNNEVLSDEQALIVEKAINNRSVETCDLFEDFVSYVTKDYNVDYDTLMNYQEHYQNLLSHKENLTILLSD
jgi:hypothetical protein